MDHQKEKQLLFELTYVDNNRGELEQLLCSVIDYPWLLGQILFNRMGGVAYLKLEESELLGKINREMRNSLRNIFQIQKIKAESFTAGLKLLSEIFENVTFRYAFLKGAFLIGNLYKDGERNSNDYDILISQRELGKVNELLLAHGFVQGKCNFNSMKITEATRFEIISSRMNRGETIPYFKRVDYLGMEYMEIDVNFSLDYKAQNENSSVDLMLKDAVMYGVGGKGLYTLNRDEFFIHLCLHLFKEAVVFNWVKMQRDLSLYKFYDILLYFYKFYKSEEEIISLKDKIIVHGAQAECYYTLIKTAALYDKLAENANYLYLTENIKPDKLLYLNEIIHPEENKIYKYDMDFKEWFFKYDRAEYLFLSKEEALNETKI